MNDKKTETTKSKKEQGIQRAAPLSVFYPF